MPSPFHEIICAVCGVGHMTRSLSARTCSPKCRAVLREQEWGPTKGAPLRQYPDELVEKIRGLYLDDGLTIAELRALVPGVKVQRVMERHQIARRPAKPRTPRIGPANPCWKGDRAGYQALHLRVEAARGKPSLCAECGATSGRFEWANLTGNYADLDDYQRMCVSCHRKFDAARRRLTGRRTSPRRGVVAHV